MKRITFSCPDELTKKLDSITGETEAIAPNGLPVRITLTRTDHIVNALWIYLNRLEERNEDNNSRRP